MEPANPAALLETARAVLALQLDDPGHTVEHDEVIYAIALLRAAVGEQIQLGGFIPLAALQAPRLGARFVP